MLPPSRLVVLGGRGFLGAEIGTIGKQAGWITLLLGSSEVNLESFNASEELTRLIEPGDVVVHSAAIAPARIPSEIARNITMTSAVVAAAEKAQANHLVVISSDAVYGSQSGLRSEISGVKPDTIHGVMHLAREMTCQMAKVPIVSIIRPSAIYGFHDPHNAYGPNRFARAVVSHEKIPLLGRGLSVRDHVAVSDVAALVCSVVRAGRPGTFNAVSGYSLSFAGIAEIIASVLPSLSEVTSVGPEVAPTFHYYDTTRVQSAFPNLHPKKPGWGMVQLVEDLARQSQEDY